MFKNSSDRTNHKYVIYLQRRSEQHDLRATRVIHVSLTGDIFCPPNLGWLLTPPDRSHHIDHGDVNTTLSQAYRVNSFLKMLVEHKIYNLNVFTQVNHELFVFNE